MKGIKNISIIILSIVFANVLNAQQTKAWSSLDSNAIMIGDQVKYELGITVPDNMIVTWPHLADTITSNIEIIKHGKIDTTYSESDITLQQQFVITSFDSGYFEIPSVDFKFRHLNDSNFYNTSTGILFLQVFVPEVDTSQVFKPIVGPIKEPYTFKEILPWIIVGIIAALLITLLIYYLVKRKNRQPVFKLKPKPALPAHVVAMNKLEKLRLAKIWQTGHLKKYYTELTDIIREYMVNRYHFDAPEMTTSEIITKLNEFEINIEAMTKLEGVLNLSDLVKFAKAVPTALENDLGLTHCADFVNETKKVADPAQTENIDNINTKDKQ
ncbi:MAG: hypothetical protein H8E34_08925 [Bacteroidetes bacterium]|nr:hypothetical protein [Bacteroidota bacterium]MBL6944830.1 hypothetical protein [Bacteroidales bacterium]